MSSLWRLYINFVPLFLLLDQSYCSCPPQEAILPCQCLTRGVEIQMWCSHSIFPKVIEGLHAAAQYIEKPIDELILENNQIPSLPGKSFAPLRIMRLMLRFNNLERVSADWLSELEDSLMELFIVEPNLRSLPEDSLNRMDNLEALTIQSGLMKRLPRISALPRLRYINVESSSLVELSPRHFKALPALEKFHVIGSGRLTRLEGGLLQDLPNLAIVNISFCGLTWIHPRAITHLPSLTELWLVGNKITDAAMVGRSIRDLPVLETLRLDYNYVEKIGEAAFVDLPSLKKLFLPHNQVTELHHGAFHRVPKLKMLDLNYNLVRRVHPESFLQHSGSGLEELWLVENDVGHVAELRALLDALPRLIFLDLSHNKLEAIPFGALRGHATLERLHLDHNKIHLVDREAFMAMPALRELRLKNNSLSDILDGPLWNLPALKGLDLSYNYFRRIDPRMFLNVPSLRRIDLSYNSIIFIDPTSFLSTPALEHVNVSNNGLSTIHPATFRHLLELFELDVGHNRLVEFVPGLPQGIEYLYMSRNQITNLPLSPNPDLNLPSLKMLDLTGNGIQKLPEGVLRGAPQLKKLHLGKNSLQQIEERSFEGLSSLQILDLHKNRLIQLHPNGLKDMKLLQELNLGDNMLTSLRSEIFRGLSQLKNLIVSTNQLNEIPPNAFETTRDLHLIDLSYNLMGLVPPTIYGMKHLRTLHLSHNKLKNIQPEILSSLISLTELHLSDNNLKVLKRGQFDNLPELKLLNLENNQLENIEPHAIHTLPALKTLKINRNKLERIPSEAFSKLPQLQIAQLEENRLKNIANDAFDQVPRLLMLNLSSNFLPTLDDSGLKSLKALEMLDLSNNRLSGITSSSLEKMEWLVELRMDNNQICSVHGSPFNGMPRLKVLSLRNNKMTSFPERAVEKLRENLAILDINGNPLVCSCSLLWFKVWLQESSLVGPRCSDGTLLRDMTITRQDCGQENRDNALVASGCEAELLSVPGVYGTSQVFSQWMDLKRNTTVQGNKLAPTPEESDYFYDEYVDYPFNETVINGTATPNIGNQQVRPEMSATSPHFIPGDTPTLYAGGFSNKTFSKNKNNIPKGVPGSPSSSGFTFFGLPLPNLNLNLNNIFRGNGRMADKTNPLQTQAQHLLSQTPSAERKSAILNNLPQPYVHHNPYGGYPPTVPEIQTGGFVPLLPGERGFKPLPTASINKTKPTIAPITEEFSITTPSSKRSDSPQEKSFNRTGSASVRESIAHEVNTSATVTKFEDFFKKFIDLPSTTIPNLDEDITDATTTTKQFSTSTRKPTTASTTITTSTTTTTTTIAPIPIPRQNEPPTALSGLLIPGGQQPQSRPPQGRPTITKVQSPRVGAPVQSDLEVSEQGGPLPLPQNGGEFVGVPEYTTRKTNEENDMSWYFVNYNKTDIEPYIGPGGSTTTRSAAGITSVVDNKFVISGIIVLSLIL